MSVFVVVVAAGLGQNSSGFGVTPRLSITPRRLNFPLVVGWFTGEQGASLPSDRIRSGLEMVSIKLQEGRAMD